MSELQTRATIVNSRSGIKSHLSRRDSDEYDEVFLMDPPPPATSGGGGENHPKTEKSFHQQEHADRQLRSSWNEPGAGTLYTGGGGPSIDDATTRAKLVHSAASLLADKELFKTHDDEFPVELATSSNLDSVMSEACASVGTPYYRHRQHRGSIFDDLLFEIYQRWHESHRDSLDSDTFTEYSSATEFAHYRSDSCHEGADRRIKKFSRSFLENQGLEKLRSIHANLRYSINQMSARLVRQLKRRDHRVAKLNCNCDLLTAFLQASSLKRRVDTRIKFSIEPPATGEDAYGQWVDAMKGVARLPLGIPEEFRKKVWLGLADNYIHEIHVDWEKTVSFAFNERCNPDDNKLGLQIVKDLHRTGCSSFSGRDNEEDRAVLKRVLLAYARWNKHVGYCQGFNVIAALLLDVFDRREDHALKVMIYLIDHVLPDSYFANNLRALSVDMAVFRDLLQWKFPPLSRHLDNLQRAAQEEASGPIYEPPLTNVFTMQWFLTLFATCLPKKTVLRMWDSILLEGSEILLRAALVIWGKLAKRIMSVGSADEFYTLMGELSQDMVNGDAFSPDRLIKSIYSISPFPFPQLGELREKYTYNIRPFTGDVGNTVKKASKNETGNLGSDEDDLDDEDMEAIRCFTGIFHMQSMNSANKAKAVDQEANGGSSCSSSDISVMGPGVYGTAAPTDAGTPAKSSVPMERMTTDLSALKKQYMKLRQRQTQAHIILTAAKAQQRQISNSVTPTIESPTAMNHLFIGRTALKKHKNRLITEGPRIASLPPTAEENTDLQLGSVRRQFGRSKSFEHPAAIGYLTKIRSRRNSSRANSLSQVTTSRHRTFSEEGIKEVPDDVVPQKEPPTRTADQKDKVPKNTDENIEHSISDKTSPNSAELEKELPQSGSTDSEVKTREDSLFSSSPLQERRKSNNINQSSLDDLQEVNLESELSSFTPSEIKDSQQLSNPVSDTELPQEVTSNDSNRQSDDFVRDESENPTLSEKKDEESVSNRDNPETPSEDLSNSQTGKSDSCATASSHSVSTDAFSSSAPLSPGDKDQTPSPKHDPNSSLSDSDTNALSFDVSGLACATVSCERVSPVSEDRDEGSMPLNTCLLNSISLDSSCSNPVSPAMSDGASSLASFFETNSESLKTSGDDEKTPQSVSPLPSEHCWDAGITTSPVINTPNNRRNRSHSYCSRDALSPTEKIGIEFNIARINGNSLCNQNVVDSVGRVRSHSTKSELSQSDPITSDSLESLSSITSEGNIYNKVSIPKLAARHTVTPSKAYLNKHCAINGMKLGLYKPSVLKTANKKQKPSLQSMFSKS